MLNWDELEDERYYRKLLRTATMQIDQREYLKNSTSCYTGNSFEQAATATVVAIVIVFGMFVVVSRLSNK